MENRSRILKRLREAGARDKGYGDREIKSGGKLRISVC